jgi:hypothetical protein
VFTLWLTSPSSQSLWISGEPGKGKTMLSIFVTRTLSAMLPKDLFFLYYFCGFSDPLRNKVLNLLRTLIWLLLKQQHELRRHILPDYRIMGDKMLSSSSAFEALWRIFVNMIQDPLLKSVHILLDGLDECDEPLLPTFLEKAAPTYGARPVVLRKRYQASCYIEVHSKLHSYISIKISSAMS